MAKKNVQTLETHTNADGTVEKTIKKYYKKEVEEDYVKVYLKTITAIHSVKGAAVQTLFEMLKRIDYKNQIIIAPAIKREMAASAGLKVNTLEHNLATLCKENILIKVDTNMYRANPFLFGRGSWEFVTGEREAIPLNAVFSEGGVTFNSTLPKVEDCEPIEGFDYENDKFG